MYVYMYVCVCVYDASAVGARRKHLFQTADTQELSPRRGILLLPRVRGRLCSCVRACVCELGCELVEAADTAVPWAGCETGRAVGWLRACTVAPRPPSLARWSCSDVCPLPSLCSEDAVRGD